MLVTENKRQELKTKFAKVLSLKNFDINDVKAGREYVEAYVQFFHFAEGEEEHGHAHKATSMDKSVLIPWILSGIFLLSTLALGYRYLRK